MIDDPIVEEIRQIRQAYAQSLSNDLHAICEDLRRQQRESNRLFRTPQDAEDRKEERAEAQRRSTASKQ